MAKFTVDTTNKLFIAKTGVVSFDVQIDLYSDGKEHWLTDTTANKFDFPVRTVAGDPISGSESISPFFFLRDGWKIRPDEVDHQLDVLGNLFIDTGEIGGLFVPTTGGFTVLVNITVSSKATSVGGDVATQVWSSNISSSPANSAGAALSELRKSGIAAIGTVIAGSTSGSIRTNLTNADGYFDGMTMHIVDGIDSITREVDAYLNINGTFILAKDAPFTPNVGAQVYVISRHSARAGRV